jgi:hypothetical protein
MASYRLPKKTSLNIFNDDTYIFLTNTQDGGRDDLITLFTFIKR